MASEARKPGPKEGQPQSTQSQAPTKASHKACRPPVGATLPDQDMEAKLEIHLPFCAEIPAHSYVSWKLQHHFFNIIFVISD